jgi:hypothetical protein
MHALNGGKAKRTKRSFHCFLHIGGNSGQCVATGCFQLAPESGNPVLRWTASNVVVRQDCAGNIKPDKERSSERIDGISALVNAPGRAQLRDHSRFIYGNGRTMLILD